MTARGTAPARWVLLAPVAVILALGVVHHLDTGAVAASTHEATVAVSAADAPIDDHASGHGGLGVDAGAVALCVAMLGVLVAAVVGSRRARSGSWRVAGPAAVAAASARPAFSSIPIRQRSSVVRC